MSTAILGAAEVVNHDPGPLRGERQGMRPADAVSGAGDDNDPSGA